MRGLLRWTQLQ